MCKHFHVSTLYTNTARYWYGGTQPSASSNSLNMQSSFLSPFYIDFFNPPSVWSYHIFHGSITPSGLRSPHYRDFVITLKHSTLGKSPLEEWSARRRDLYLKKHNTHKRGISIPLWDSNPQSQERAAADPRLRLLGYWNRPSLSYPTPVTHTPNYIINQSGYPGTETWLWLFKSRIEDGFRIYVIANGRVIESFWYV